MSDDDLDDGKRRTRIGGQRDESMPEGMKADVYLRPFALLLGLCLNTRRREYALYVTAEERVVALVGFRDFRHDVARALL